MSGAAPVRERVNPRRPPGERGTAARTPHKLHKSPWPWHDRTGRFSKHKTGALLLEVAPAAVLLWLFLAHRLGASPVTELIHQSGLWSIRFLMLSLLVSPARAIFNWHKVMLVRRQLGLTALFYALAHLVLYAADENWRMGTVAMEILARFYLTIGFTALVGLAVLGVTSFDTTLRRMGHWWKRVHRVVYAMTVLVLVHFFLQSKANVDQALLMSGVFFWLMGWRMMQAGPDRAPLPVLAMGVCAALVTAAVEYLWFDLATRIDPLRPVRAELDLGYGPHPAGQVLVLGLCMAMATALFWARQRESVKTGAPYSAALYAGGAAISAGLLFAFSLATDWLPDDWPLWHPAALFVLGFAVLGGLRWLLPQVPRRALDWACGACLLAPLAYGLYVG